LEKNEELYHNKYISKIRDAVEAIKKKTAVFQYVQMLHATQRSPYYYINEERKKLWKKINHHEGGLSSFQRSCIFGTKIRGLWLISPTVSFL